jgi:hypothetical protein
MRRLLLSLLLTGTVSTLSAPAAFCAGNVLFSLGGRQLEDDAEPFDEQGEFGVNLMYGKETWPVSLSFALLGSYDEQRVSAPFGLPALLVDAELGIGELAVGVTKVWEKHTHARPYLGGGLSFLSARIEATEVTTGLSRDADDGTVAPYAEGGVFWRLGKGFNIGLGARLLFGAEVEFEGVEIDANYSQVHGLIGWGW